MTKEEILAAEVEMLRGVGCMTSDKHGEGPSGPCGVCRKCAFRRGVDAMRQAAADLFEGTQDKPGLAKMPLWAKFIHSLPDPEDK